MEGDAEGAESLVMLAESCIAVQLIAWALGASSRGLPAGTGRWRQLTSVVIKTSKVAYLEQSLMSEVA